MIKQNTGSGLVFFAFAILITLRKQVAGLAGKGLRLSSKEQAFNLLGSHKFIEIKGVSGIGKSGALIHIFKNLEAVKFTNAPTPNGIYTLTKETFQAHMVGKGEVSHKG